MIVNKKQLTEVFNVTSRTVEDWESKGMPILSKPGRGKANEYDTAICIDWRLRHMINGGRHTTAKERREEAEAQLKEIEVAEKTDQFLLTEDVEAMMTYAITASRASFLSSARKIKKRLDSEYKIDTQLQFINGLVHESLTRLADGFNFDQFRFESDNGNINFYIGEDKYQIEEVENKNDLLS